MRLRPFGLPVLGSLFLAVAGSGQSPPAASKDPQAILVLGQCLNAAGGAQAFATVQDLTASGSITYHWAGQDVQGSVTVRGKGSDRFRLDASLPSGARSWLVSAGSGSVKEPDGETVSIPYHNALTLSSLTFPYPKLLVAINDPSTSVRYMGVVETAGHTTQQVSATRYLPAQFDRDGILTGLNKVDFFIDTTTLQLVEIQDLTHARESTTDHYVHKIEFGDYRPVNGVLVPFSVTEKIGGQRTWTLQLTSITFNLGLTDADFQF